ncbi:MAG TPA: glycine cleavage T C-terminal barrel domain-containing protein [Solirubrobacteraceae bacterium]|jgi:folate-binding protein YgfZ|nr:glycine cleavage T C-terminal barrel domain-containing protein [Solirubrobacteraceae bacterium]
MSAINAIRASAADSQQEHDALRERCGLLDRSERGKLALAGAGAAGFLNGQVTNDVEGLQAGEGCYAAFLTHKGKMLGDLRILRAEDELLLDTERVALQSLFDMIRRFKIGFDVELHKRTIERGLLSLIGPQAREIASTAGADALPAAVEHANCATSIAGRPVRLIATAAPEGLDVLCEADDLDAARFALVNAGALPVSEESAQALRVELGVPRYGVDLDESVIPQEAGLNERAVSFTKGCYVGQETVARLYYRGKPNRLLRGLLLCEPAATAEPVHLGQRLVGHLGSTAISPSLGPIALCLLRHEAAPGQHVMVGERERPAEVVELPFSA